MMEPEKSDLESLLPEKGTEILQTLVLEKPDLLITAIELCPLNITISDVNLPDIPLIYVNRAFTQTTGYQQDEVIGRNCRFLQGKDTEPEAVEMLRAGLRNEERVFVEFTNYKKDGTPFLNALTLAPVHNQKGNLVSFIGIQNDVTERRKLQKSEIHEQRLSALGQMAGGVAHQLNNLLQPVISLTALHKNNMSDTQMAEDFDVVLESSRQAAGVVKDILSFSRQDIEILKIVSVHEALVQNIFFIKKLLPPKIELKLNIDDVVINNVIKIDNIKFCQALSNIIINAAQAMNNNGVINVSVFDGENNKIIISIKDNGPGIPDEIISRIFEPFFTTKFQDGGSGLGLSVVYGIIKSFGGTITIENEKTESSQYGCNVKLYLPKF